MKPSGACDVCKSRPAQFWYGNTAAAVCENIVCHEKMDERYEEHCEEVDRQIEFEKQMEEEFGHE